MDEMRRSVIYMLADAAQGEDEDGLRRMRRALDPGVWNALRALLIRTRAPGLSPCISKASFMLDKALQSAQKHDYWKIDVDTALFVARNPTEAYDPLGLDKALAQVMASLYADWGAYHSIWSGREVLGTMMRLVREGRQTEAWERVDQVRQCADRRGSLLAVLPRQVVDHLLVPMVLEGV